MKVVCTRVDKASVVVDKQEVSKIKKGLLLLVGVEVLDTEEDAVWLTNKIANLRIFSDTNDIMSFSCLDVEGEVLCVSQFTLCASVKKGTKPSFSGAMEPAGAKKLFDTFVKKMQEHLNVKTGVFGANMEIISTNQGPVTIWLDSKNRS